MTYQIDMTKLKNLVKDYTKQAYHQFIDENKSEKICALSIVTDGSVMTLSVRANTKSNLRGIKSLFFLSEKTWITDEWKLEDMSIHAELDHFLEEIEKIRFSEEYRYDDNMYYKYKSGYLNACIVALEELQKEEVIPFSDDFITLVQITDHEEIEGMYNRLNTKKRKKDYDKFFNGDFFKLDSISVN